MITNKSKEILFIRVISKFKGFSWLRRSELDHIRLPKMSNI